MNTILNMPMPWTDERIFGRMGGINARHLGAIIPAAIGFGAQQLFGGGGGGRTSGQSLQQAPTQSPQQQALLNRLIGFAQPQIGQVGRVPGQELGPIGPSALQQQAFGLAGQLPQQLAFDPAQITQQFQPTAQFVRQGFQQETIPAIAGAVGFGGGARSSGFQDILAREGRNLELGLAAQLGQQQFGAQQASLGRQFQLPGQIANIGALQRGIPAEQQAFGLARFQQQDPLRNPAITLALQSLGIPTQENIAFQGFRQPSTLESLLPAAGQVLGGAFQGGFFN
ncbi:hypothetical protein LCGC14_0891470 [marine sediment metagenome]|uniref:Uncharacterized protein n=1 Tax=marine sediment metagenome TaxID=412755 RepID=A0A0F9S659_9ZZZZ